MDRDAIIDRRTRVLVLGAGSSGLAAAKNLLEHGFAVDLVEREDDLGGNWHYGKPNARVYASTHMISSKPFTAYPDFPMDDDWPDYLHHRQVLSYLRRYFQHFGLRAVTEFSTAVVRIERPTTGEAEGWWVTVERPDGVVETRHYGVVVVANGHNWYPKMPEYPGRFTGEVLHSAHYRHAGQLAGKRVLVVGAGNTGCDVAVEAAQRATAAFHSTRRAYWYAPKYSLGRPSDQVYDLLLSLPLPMRGVQWLLETVGSLVNGDITRFGLKKPDHHFLETHPIVNSQLLYHLGHGDIAPKPDVARFDERTVHFVDGTSESIDLVVYCTGYLIRFPFFTGHELDFEDGRPLLYKNVFHPSADDLFVIGLIQPDSGQFGLVHWQSVCVARYLEAKRDRPHRAARFRDEMVRHLREHLGAGVTYKDSTRHLVEIQHMEYLRGLRHLLEVLG